MIMTFFKRFMESVIFALNFQRHLNKGRVFYGVLPLNLIVFFLKNISLHAVTQTTYFCEIWVQLDNFAAIDNSSTF